MSPISYLLSRHLPRSVTNCSLSHVTGMEHWYKTKMLHVAWNTQKKKKNPGDTAVLDKYFVLFKCCGGGVRPNKFWLLDRIPRIFYRKSSNKTCKQIFFHARAVNQNKNSVDVSISQISKGTHELLTSVGDNTQTGEREANIYPIYIYI